MSATEVESVNALYEAWSESLAQETCGIIRWIPLRAERIRVAPYSILIRDFDALSSAGQSLAKGFADEFFGLSEWNLLAAAFTGDGVLSLRRRTIDLPISCRDEAGNILLPLRCREDLKEHRVAECPFRPLPYGVLGIRLPASR